MPLNDSIITFAEVLRKRGYATSYLGKWHLDGDAKPVGLRPESLVFLIIVSCSIGDIGKNSR